MKFSTKIALAAAGVFLMFALCFSGWMLSRYRRDTLEEIQKNEKESLEEGQRQFEERAGRLPDRLADVGEREAFRQCFDRTSALYREERAIYNMTGYDFDWGAYERGKAGGETAGKNGWEGCFYQEEGGKRLQIFVLRGVTEVGKYAIVHYRDVTAIYDRVQRMFWEGLLGAAGLGVAFVLLLQLVLFQLWRPFRRLQEAANRIAGGSYEVRAELGRRDEIGQVAESFDRMAEKVEEHVRELLRVNERQQQLLGSLAHELKTPMTAILGYAETLQRVKLPPDRRDKALRYIESECRRLSGLSAKMLELTGLHQEEGALESGEVSVERLFERAEGLARYRLQQREIRLRREISPAACALRGDEDLLVSFLLNLIDNGCKASRKGGELVLTADGQGIGLQDFGCGIPQEELDRVTEAFYMVDKSRSRREGGAGLGLALCRRIAELHGARLVIESREGEGTWVRMCWGGSGS